MKPDIVIRLEAMETLIAKLGEVDTERFIQMIKMDTFDYSQWRDDLWKGKSVDEIHQLAAEYERRNN